jgi:hypothetical protein
MRRLGWRLAALATFPVFVLGMLLALPKVILVKVLPWCGAFISEPFLRSVRRARGWQTVGDLWVKGAHRGRQNRRVKPCA